MEALKRDVIIGDVLADRRKENNINDDDDDDEIDVDIEEDESDDVQKKCSSRTTANNVNVVKFSIDALLKQKCETSRTSETFSTFDKNVAMSAAISALMVRRQFVVSHTSDLQVAAF